MKLIQQLERKLSWRSSQRSTPGLAEAKAKQRKENGKKQRQQQQLMAAKTAAAVRVSDAEFSPYISFGSGLKTVPLNDDSSPTSYEVVAIRTRAPFQTVAQQSSLYSSPHHHHHPRSPSPRSEGHRPESAGGGGDHHHHQQQQQQKQQQPKNVEHIYDQIDCHHRRSSSLSPTTTTTHYQNHDHHHQWSPSSEGKQQNHFGSQSPTTSSGSNESSGSGTGSGSSHCGPITVTGGSSRRRRNRIKTNPWFAGSPWAAPATKSSKENHQQQQQDKENIYESIENLLLNNRRKQQPPINQSYTRPFAQPPPQNSSATYLRRPARPTSLAVQKRKHLMETYPTSPMYLSSNQTVNPAEESPADLLLFTSPSVEFLNQSQQLCRQISSYFEDMSSRASPPPPREALNSSSSTTTRPSLERKVDTHQNSSLLFNTSDSMETIDLSPVNPFNHQPALSEWSLAAENDNDDDNDNGNDHQWDSTTTVPTISSPAPPPPPSTKSPSPPTRSKRKLQSPTSRPESLYSNPNSPRRQSAKVDRLKCQLKEVVHAAIQQAKTKKNRKEV